MRFDKVDKKKIRPKVIYNFHYSNGASAILTSVNLEKKIWNSQFFQKTNETREKVILRALRIVFSCLSFVVFFEELIISKIAFEI